MSDISRPGYRAACAIAEYAEFYGAGEPETRVRRLVEDGIAEVRAYLDPKEITNMALEIMTDPER